MRMLSQNGSGQVRLSQANVRLLDAKVKSGHLRSG